MIRGGKFYAVWDSELGVWSMDEYTIQKYIDDDLSKRKDELEKILSDTIKVKYTKNYNSGSWKMFKEYTKNLSDNFHQLDTDITFAHDVISKTDYRSKRVPYDLVEGPAKAYHELMSVLYTNEERDKIEWAIGACLVGDAKTIQKFIVLYGEAGTGKSTILNIIQKLFEGYYTTFEAKALVGNNNQFAMESFRNNPVVAIQHDGDLSKIEDNTKLNSLVSHEVMNINEKYKSSYSGTHNCFLFMGTNKPVKITDSKSGIIRRLIDVVPTGNKISTKKYFELSNQIDFEIGEIATYCINKYRTMGKNYYALYTPLTMMFETDAFFNFVEDNYYIFDCPDGVTLKQAYDIYKEYCDSSGLEYKLSKYKFREELKHYFGTYTERGRVSDKLTYNVYKNFKTEKFNKIASEAVVGGVSWLDFGCTDSYIDKLLGDCKAQYTTDKETPLCKWDEVDSRLSELDTTRLHYVKPPLNHIVIDFDLKDVDGNKSLALNIEAASKWPKTYAEVSKGGNGLHLHYIYDLDPEQLSRVHSDGIEIKVFSGNASLRRKRIKNNCLEVSTLSGGLPRKERKVIDSKVIEDEKHLRTMIIKNLKKEIHPGTKPSMDFIDKLLQDAYDSGMKYDVTDMRQKILVFANNSSNQAEYCIRLIDKLKLKSEDSSDNIENYVEDRLVFFDIECFPNLFVICWKFKGDPVKIRMINPTAQEVGELFKYKLVGFFNRGYDNHMIYAAYLGYNNEQLYNLSQKLINDVPNSKFGEAYNISYTDVYDFSSAVNKKSLKKWEIELDITHVELDIPWDQPVPKERWKEVADYCCNDVDATEIVFDHLKGDWAARRVSAALSGLTVNDTTNQHTIKIIFPDVKDTKPYLVYTDLSTIFPGYKFEYGKSTYKGYDASEGGFVIAKPGGHSNVEVYDLTSMHPSSIIALNLFGKYTKNYADLKSGRVFIKHNDMVGLDKLLDGKIKKVLDEFQDLSLKDVSNGLKTNLNSGYGLTAAHFDNALRDPRNVDNIVAKRGALFMIELLTQCIDRGYDVVHMKTDSIKVANPTQECKEFIFDLAKKYDYEFEHETTYKKFCLINKAEYIAQTIDGEWESCGKRFSHPYVFKTLFDKNSSFSFEDYIEVFSVKTKMFLDFENGQDKMFVGKCNAFIPVKEGGGVLLRQSTDGSKYGAVGGTKGYKWIEAYTLKDIENHDKIIDWSYYDKLVDDSIKEIEKVGCSHEWLMKEEVEDLPPWECPKSSRQYFCDTDCEQCMECLNRNRCLPF